MNDNIRAEFFPGFLPGHDATDKMLAEIARLRAELAASQSRAGKVESTLDRLISIVRGYLYGMGEDGQEAEKLVDEYESALLSPAGASATDAGDVA